MRPSLLDPLFAPAGVAARHRTEEREAVRPPARQARRARACVDVLFHLPYATLDRRVTAEDPRRRSRDDRHDRGHGHGASRAAERSLARAVQGAGRGRHRRRRTRVLSRQSCMGALAPADRRDALDLRQARALGRPPSDRPSRPGHGRGRTRPPARRRAGLWPDRRPLSAHGRARGRGRAEAAAPPARMDRRRDARETEAAGLRRGAGSDAPAGCARRISIRPGPPRPASPTTNCWPTSSRCSWCARGCARSPAARMSPRARCADGSRRRCPSR